MNTNLNNFIDSEAKTVDEIRAQLAAIDIANAELAAKIKEIKGEKPKKSSGDAKLYATPQYDFLDAESKSSIDSLSTWEINDEFRDLSTADVIAIDTETYDPDLRTAGSGWARGTGYILGVSVAAAWGEDIWSNYYPLSHPDTQNFDTEKVMQYVTESLTSNKVKIFANAEYDMGWLNRYGVPLSAFLHTGPLDDVLAMAVLVDETWMSHSLDKVGSFYCDEHKDESMLFDPRVRSAYGLIKPKSDMYKLPAKFVGPYAEQDAVLNIKCYWKLKKLIEAHPVTGKSLEEVYDLERRLIPMLFETHKRGVRVDLERAEQVKSDLKLEVTKLEEQLYNLSGMRVNVMSGDDLGAACDKLNISYPRTSKTNKPSFTAPFLEGHESEFLRTVRSVRKINKVQSTFVDSVLDKAVNGRIYPQLNALKRTDDGDDTGSSGTITGRFSCTKPNLQQVSSRDEILAPIVRSMFLPDEGFEWGTFDYSQQEPRMTIHIAALLHRNGTVGLDRVEEAVRRFNENPRTDNHQMVADLACITRREAKTINLGLSYGMGALKLARSLGLPTEWVDNREVAGPETKALMKLFNQKIPYLKGFMNCAGDLAKNRGAVTTLLGRHSRYEMWTSKNWKQSQHLGIKPKADIEKELAELGEKSQWHGVSLVRAMTFNAMNHIVQGSSADQTKLAMVRCYENKVVLPYTQIHDSLECPIDITRKHEHIKQIQHEMVHAIELLVPTVVDIKVGTTWGNVKKYEL